MYGITRNFYEFRAMNFSISGRFRIPYGRDGSEGKKFREHPSGCTTFKNLYSIVLCKYRKCTLHTHK